MDFDQLLHELAEQKSWNLLYMKDEDQYKFTLSIPGDRFQDVYVNFRKDPEGWHVSTIWSVVSDIPDFNMTDPLELLRFNWRTLFGSLAVKGEEVVIVQNQLTDEANWNEVAKAIHYIANTADAIEQEIYGDQDDR